MFHNALVGTISGLRCRRRRNLRLTKQSCDRERVLRANSLGDEVMEQGTGRDLVLVRLTHDGLPVGWWL